MIHLLGEVFHPLNGITMTDQYRIFSLDNDEILHPDRTYDPSI